MPNPVIAPLSADQPSYTITNTKDLGIDLYLSALDEGAEFTLTCPTTDTVTLIQGATSVTLTTGAGTQNPAFPGRTVTVNVTVAAGQSTLDVQISAAAPASEYWRVTANGAGPNSRAITEGANADIVRVLADPSVSVSGAITVKEKSHFTLSGNIDYTMVAKVPPAAGLAPQPPIGGIWEQVGGSAVAAPGPTSLVGIVASADIDTPSVYAPTSVTYQLTAFYDLNSNSARDAGEPFNTAQQTATVDARNTHMILLLDRSGSMGASLGTVSRWEAARRAAHVWADLFIAFRTGVASDHAGVMVFEANTCGWGTVATPIDVLNPANHAVISVPGNLASIDSNVFDLGNPGSCTPIGDGLVKAIDKFVALSGTAEDRYVLVLLTDGYENSGSVQVKEGATAAGVTLFSAARGSGTRSTVNPKLTIYSIGVGGTVQEDVLNDLPNPPTTGTPPPGGYYRLVTQPQDVLPTFAQMLGHSIDAQTLPVTFTDAGANHFGSFMVNSNENRIAIVLQWDAAADDMRVSWRKQGSAGSFAPAAGGGVAPPAGVTHRRRDTHGQTSIDLQQYFVTTLGEPFVPATEWKIEYLPGGGAPAAITPAKLIALVDLFLKAEIKFDRGTYGTGDPMRITCRLRAGHQPVLNAFITTELARPGEGLGTFLVTNSQGYQPSQPRPGDVPPPKQQMLQDLLRKKDWNGLPEIRPPKIFSDGSNELLDDGAHQDGSANDGDYANIFTDTTKEGTYTWRFFVRGTLPDGTQYGRVLSVSKWVGVNVDPASSTVTMTLGAVAGGLQTATVVVVPKDRRGEFLGPFRTEQIQFSTTAGTFAKTITSNFDGSYANVLSFPAGTVPVVTVTVKGQDFPPAAVLPSRKNCICEFIVCILRWLGFRR